MHSRVLERQLAYEPDESALGSRGPRNRGPGQPSRPARLELRRHELRDAGHGCDQRAVDEREHQPEALAGGDPRDPARDRQLPARRRADYSKYADGADGTGRVNSYYARLTASKRESGTTPQFRAHDYGLMTASDRAAPRASPGGSSLPAPPPPPALPGTVMRCRLDFPATATTVHPRAPSDHAAAGSAASTAPRRPAARHERGRNGPARTASSRQGAGDGVEPALGDAAHVAAREPRVVRDAHPGEHGDLLAPEPGDAAAAVRVQAPSRSSSRHQRSSSGRV